MQPVTLPTATEPVRETTFLESTHDLESCSRLPVEALAALFARGLTPASVAVLEGDARGRILSASGLDGGVLGPFVRSFAGGPLFPWIGKSFRGRGEKGEGVNHFRLAGRRELFRFRTRVQPSAIDGEPCIALDYDVHGNPPLVRAVLDEMRETGPGLFLGPGMVRSARDPWLVFWFALDIRARRVSRID